MYGCFVLIRKNFLVQTNLYLNDCIFVFREFSFSAWRSERSKAKIMKKRAKKADWFLALHSFTELEKVHIQNNPIQNSPIQNSPAYFCGESAKSASLLLCDDGLLVFRQTTSVDKLQVSTSVGLHLLGKLATHLCDCCCRHYFLV